MTTETYHILENFPSEILQGLKQCWKNNNWAEVKDIYKSKFFHYVLDNSHSIYENFPGCAAVEFYEQIPGVLNSPHLDRGRWCAINIPIEVDFQNSYFYIGKHFLLKKYQPEERNLETDAYQHNAGYRGPNGFYHWDDRLMEKYNLENPVVFSTKVPHGGVNTKSKTNRIIASIGYVDYTYEQLLNMLPPEWF